MKLAGFTAVLIATIAMPAAHAAPGFIVTPRGWTLEVDASRSLTTKANAVSHFGGAPSVATAAIYLPPARRLPQQPPAVALFVTSVGAKLTQHREAAIRVEVDELHAAARRAALSGTDIVEHGWEERVDPAKRQVVARLVWSDRGAGTKTTSQLVIAADGEHVIAVTGECVESETPIYKDDDAAARAPGECGAALDTLDPDIALANRVELALAPTGTSPPEAVTPAANTAREPARMDDGARAPLPPIQVRKEQRPTDRRPVYVGFGIVVLAALFWWNRHRRARIEEEEPDDR